MTVNKVLYDADWTAICTIVLTCVTFYYAIITSRILRVTARQAAAAEQTVALLIKERTDHLRRMRAPVEYMIRSGMSRAEEYLSGATASGAFRAESSELEAAGLAATIDNLRGQYFPLAQALRDVDRQIIKARAAVDNLGQLVNAEADILIAGDELRELVRQWQYAQEVLSTWQ